jgi:membrane peptidoglycan carboxypeptidase
MTPHVMDQIRDSDGNLVEQYQPTPWKQATSAATAQAITALMQKVVTNGTADGRGLSSPRTTWRPRRGRPRPAWATPT